MALLVLRGRDALTRSPTLEQYDSTPTDVVQSAGSEHEYRGARVAGGGQPVLLLVLPRRQ